MAEQGISEKVNKDQIVEALRTCFDPEIPMNIVDLGLIYDVKIFDGSVNVKMTLTALGCPLSSYLESDMKSKIKQIQGVKNVQIEVVWEPPWSPEKMSKEAREILGM